MMLFGDRTSALAPELVGEVLEPMRSRAANGMLVITHGMGIAKRVGDRLVFLTMAPSRRKARPGRCSTTRRTCELSSFRHHL